jgi:mono/diheme cytochrome c family protein/cytochrome c5
LKRLLKVAAASIASLLLLAALALGAAAWLGTRKLERTVDIRVVPVAFTKDPAALKQGKYLYESRGCAECHGADGRGKVFLDTPEGMYARTPNLTTGAASAVADYNEGDWVRAIRHGVNPKGHALFLMPAEDYNRLADADFAALVAYVRSLPPLAGEPGALRLPLIVKALYGADIIKDSSQKIDHRLAPPPSVIAAANADYGGYVTHMCEGCHGATLAGGPIAGAPPDWPPAANLTPGEGSVMPRYDTAQKFVAMMRTARRPDGTEVNKAMPFATLRNMNDMDLEAIYAFLHTVAPRKTGDH